MKKLKRKIKRALAAFLKEELLDYIGYTTAPFGTTHIIDQIEFDTMKMECVISIDNQQYFEKAIEDAKHKFCTEMMHHIHIDTSTLLSPMYTRERVIRLTLRIQKRK